MYDLTACTHIYLVISYFYLDLSEIISPDSLIDQLVPDVMAKDHKDILHTFDLFETVKYWIPIEHHHGIPANIFPCGEICLNLRIFVRSSY